jgi:Arc/MetJ-type ribon-helix-helix transcriptional regulator
MPKLTVELSEDAIAWIRDKVEEGHFPSESAYLQSLVQWQIQALHDALERGERSGISDKTVDEIWRDVLARHKAVNPVDA